MNQCAMHLALGHNEGQQQNTTRNTVLRSDCRMPEIITPNMAGLSILQCERLLHAGAAC